MIEILTVCTGNICRSPLAAVLLNNRLASLGVTVSSAGVAAASGSPMTPESVQLAVKYGADASAAEAHRSRRLTAAQLQTPDLILAMDRSHRRAVVELLPRRMRTTFTIREFARLSSALTDDAIRGAVAASAAETPSDRLRAAVAQVAAARGSLEPPTEPDADDIPDPYRRAWEVHAWSAALVANAVDEVSRVARAALA